MADFINVGRGKMKNTKTGYSYGDFRRPGRTELNEARRLEKTQMKNFAKSNAVKKAKGMYTSPTGSKHRIGSNKHKYWEDIKKRGEADKNYGAGD